MRGNQSSVRIIFMILIGSGLAVVGAILFSSLSPGTRRIDYSQYPQSVDTTEGLGAIGYVLGQPDAPVTVVVYSDFACPDCFQFKTELDTVIQQEVAAGQARVVYKIVTFMLPSSSVPAGAAAHCAGQQGQFWAMYNELWQLFANNGVSSFNVTLLTQRAEQLDGISSSAFRQCFTAPSTEAALNNLAQEAARREVNTAPTVFVNGQQIDLGTDPSATLQQAIQQAAP